MRRGVGKFEVRPAGAGRPARARAAAGLTLVELLVAISILVILILIFNMVFTQSQKVVARSQAKMRGTAAVAAIAEVIRTDLRGLTFNGFLCITQAAQGDPPQLLFTTAGFASSLTSAGGKATATISGYGLCENPEKKKLFWHASWLLDAGGTAARETDVFKIDLSDLGPYARAQLSAQLIQRRLLTDTYVPTKVDVPPATLNDMKLLWKYLHANCSALGITWTDGELDSGKNVKWYGLEYELDDGNVKVVVNEKDEDWNTKNPMTGNPEFNGGSGRYRALWTHHDQINWPKALKIRFRVSDPSLPAEFRDVDYEVICPIGK